MSTASHNTESELAEFIGRFYDDPFGFVMAVFPWGEPTLADGSPNPLAKKKGPEPWQEKLLKALGDHIKENGDLRLLDMDMRVWRSAIASGHGIGKSAMVAWLIYFMMSTRVNTRGVVTANTASQLETKTWPELSKWHNLALNKHWFTWTATSFYFAHYPEERRKNYMVNALTVSEQNTEAFAGLHNEEGTVFAIFDEASGIIPKLWEVIDGALTDGEGFFFAFGNPTRPDGEFYECFAKYKDMYYTQHVDSREVSHTNKTALDDIIRKYGLDSDEVKVRVRGIFPSQSFNGFIGMHSVVSAINRELWSDPSAGLIMAVDVARFGDDETVIGYRQGRDARTRPMRYFKGLSTTRIAEIVKIEASKEQPDAIVIESTGPGAGVIDMLRDSGWRVHEVHPGAPANDHQHYYNKRAEMWGAMRDWLDEEGCINDDPEFNKQCVSMMYFLDAKEQKIILESKKDMKKRGLSSPDRADTLALTFGVKVARRDRRTSKSRATVAKTEYDPFAV